MGSTRSQTRPASAACSDAEQRKGTLPHRIAARRWRAAFEPPNQLMRLIIGGQCASLETSGAQVMHRSLAALGLALLALAAVGLVMVM